jgi:tripartite-type tricarboxylate transporter receptor subunit TctC
MVTRRDFVRTAAAASAAAIAAPATLRAQADDYPSQPIRSICPFGPGSGADIRVRFYSHKLSLLTGKPAIVENKPGALGNIATETVARAKPDGYTIYNTPGSSTLASAPSLFKQLNYDPINDFEHITTLSTSAFVLCVSANSPFKTAAELTDYLKAQGDKASYGSAAPPGLVSSEIYKQAFGLKTVEVKYRDLNGLFNDLHSGQLAFTHIDMTTIGAQLKAGRVRALHVTSAKRLKAVPDIPGAEEVGIPGMNVVTWWSVHVPAKTPKAICDKLETWFNQIAVDPEVVKFNHDIGSDIMPGNSQMLRELLIKQTELWRGYAKLANMQPE